MKRIAFFLLIFGLLFACASLGKEESLEEKYDTRSRLEKWQCPEGCHNYESVFADAAILKNYFDTSDVFGQFNSEEGDIAGILRTLDTVNGNRLTIYLDNHPDDLQRVAEKFFLDAGIPLQLIVGWQAPNKRKIIRIINAE